MSQFCPLYKRTVLYLECIECETKECRRTNIVDAFTENDKEKNSKGDDSSNEN